MHKNIINGGRTYGNIGGGGGGGFDEQHLVVNFVSDQDSTIDVAIHLQRQGTFVRMVVSGITFNSEYDINMFSASSAIPDGWRPFGRSAVGVFSSLMNINSVPGAYEYDVDILSICVVRLDGKITIYKEPPPGTGVWTQPSELTRPGWGTFSMSWCLL